MKKNSSRLGDVVIEELNKILANPPNLDELIDKKRKEIFIRIVNGKISPKKQERLKNIVGQENWGKYLDEAKKDLGSSCPKRKHHID